MKWSFANDLPIYTQLIDQIKVGIVTGAFPPGERLPSVRDLATEAGVNPNTMQRALSQLESEGLVYSQRTAGRFVTEDDAHRGNKARSGPAARRAVHGGHAQPGDLQGGDALAAGSGIWKGDRDE